MSNSKHNRIFTLAYEGRTQEVVDMVDENPESLKSVDEQCRLLIHWAALGGEIDLVSYLLGRGQPVDAVEDMGMTPLILASSAGRFPVVKKLVEHGANVNARSNNGHSSLQYAASKSWLPIAVYLVENGADINIADNYGATPLHRACSKGVSRLVKFLLSCKGIAVDAKDISGNTPLHLACIEGSAEEIKYLIQHGADTSILNKEKHTPFQLIPKELAVALRQQFINSN